MRPLVLATLGATLLWAACTDGLMDARRPAPIGIVPSFQVVPPLFTSAPIDNIRLTARHATTLAVVGSLSQSVDPTAAQWTLSLSIEMGDAVSLEVVVDVELLNGQTVLWSGRSPPTIVAVGQSGSAQTVDVYRGPLGNLDVTSVAIQGGPAQLMVGETATLSATVTLAPGSTVTPSVFWGSTAPIIASVGAEGPSVTLTAVSAGTASIVAGAGPQTAQHAIEILPRVSSVVVTPGSATLVGIGLTAQFGAAVTNGYGASDPSAPVMWSSANPSVATVSPSGVATSVGAGATQIQATSFGVVGSATLTVEGTPPPAGTRSWIGGDATDPTGWQVAANWTPAIVPGSGDDVVIATAAYTPVLAADVAIASVVNAGGSVIDLAGFTMSVTGDVDAPLGIVNGLVDVTGPGAVLGGVFPDLTITADRALTDVTLATGDLAIDNAVVTLAGNALEAGANLTVTGAGGQLVMTDPADVLYVLGNALFDGGSHDGALTAGSIALVGDLTVTSSSPTGFVSSGTQDVLFLGASALVSFATPGPAGQRMANVVVNSQNAVTFVTDAYVAADFELLGRLGVPANTTTTIGGALTLYAGGTLDVSGTVVASGGCFNNGGTILGTGTQPCGAPTQVDRIWVGGAAGAASDWNAAANWNPSGVPITTETVYVPSTATPPVLTGNVAIAGITVQDFTTLDLGGFALSVTGDVRAGQTIVNGTVQVTGTAGLLQGQVPNLTVSANRNVTGPLTVNGNLVLANADLGIQQHFVGVMGDFTSTGVGAQLVMTDPSGVLDVEGDVTFDGASISGLLTAGTLLVGGDFTVAATSSTTSFVGSGGHTTYFDGVGPQAVSFSNPATNLQRFQNLTFAGSGMVTFATDVVAMGVVTVLAGTTVDGGDDVVSIGGGFVDQINGLALQELRVVGDLTSIPPTVPADVRVDANFVLPNATGVTGNVTLNNADLNIGANTLNVGGDFASTGAGAQLVMQDPAGVLDVAGSALFDGASTSGLLTAGTLRVAGAFTSSATSSTSSYTGSGTHTTILDGAGPQTVSFATPATNLARFQNLAFQNTGVVTLGSALVAMGAVTVQPGSAVDGSTVPVSIGGSFADAGGGMSMLELRVVGNLTAIEALVPAPVRVDASWVLPNSFTVTGSFTLNNADVDVRANTLTVQGAFAVTGGAAQVIMQDPAGVLDVAGAVSYAGASTSGLQTAGTLRVGGDFTATSTTSATSFVGSGSHTTVFDGTGPQTISLSDPATNLQRFQNITFQNTGTVVVGTALVAMGTLTVQSPSVVDAANVPVSIGGAFVDPSNGLSLQELRVVGDLTAIAAIVPAPMRVAASFNLPNGTTVSGDVTLDNADMNVAANTLVVGGDFIVTGVGAQLIMQNAAGAIDVAGSASFDGATTSGLLTAGTLSVAGDFVAAGTSSPSSFVASGTHTTVLDGAAPQAMSFSSPATNLQRFQNLTLQNVGVVFAGSDFVVMGALDHQGIEQVDAANYVVSIGGSFTDADNLVQMAELRVVGSLTAIPPSLQTNVRVDATWTVPSSVFVSGALTLNNADLNVGANTVNVAGDFTVTGAGAQLIMQNAAGVLDVAGSASFDGGTTSGLLTAGVLRLAGDVTALSTSSSTSFVGVLNHLVVLDGTGVQRVAFASPAANLQRFQDLDVTNTSGSIVFDTDAFVMGALNAGNVTMVRGQAGTLEVRGSVNFDVVTLNGLPLRLDSSVAPGSHIMDNVTFDNMSTTDVQLYLRLPGGLGALTTNNMTFVTRPASPPGYYVDAVSSNGGAWDLRMVQPSPGSAVGLFNTDGNVNVIWPF